MDLLKFGRNSKDGENIEGGTKRKKKKEGSRTGSRDGGSKDGKERKEGRRGSKDRPRRKKEAEEGSVAKSGTGRSRVARGASTAPGDGPLRRRGDAAAAPDEMDGGDVIPINANLQISRDIFRRGKMKTSDFEWFATVGKGTFGNVKMVKMRGMAREKINSAGCPELPQLAIKTMKKRNIIELDQVHHIKAEVQILGALDHPNIIGLYGVMQDATRVFLLMEYIKGGELFSLLSNQQFFGYDQSQFYAAQVTLAFEYLHAQKIAYRDLKPENLLIDEKGYLKVADFGFAKIIEGRTWTICGTPEYIAPEIIMSKGHGAGVDWWGLGILIFEMMTGQPPFMHENTMYLYKMIQEVQIKYPRQMDIKTKDLVRRLLVKDLTRRYGCLKAGAGDIKRHKFFKGLDWQALLDSKVPAPWVPEFGENEAFDKYFDPYPDSVEGPGKITKDEQLVHFDDFYNW